MDESSVTRGQRVVQPLLFPDGKLFMIVGGEEKAAFTRVLEVCENYIGQHNGTFLATASTLGRTPSSFGT